MPFDNFDDDQWRAEKLQSAFRQVVWAFLEEDAGATLEKLLKNEIPEFKGGNVAQKPEEFTQRTIVEGVLKALGFNVRHHPVQLVKDERKQPDIELRNLGEQCVGIVECKPLLEERNDDKALQDLEERYLKTNAFAHYKKSPDMKYLVGIATDGFDWKLRIKDLETGGMVPEHASEYSLVDDSEGIHHCYYTERHENTRTHWPAIRDELAVDFVSSFGIHNLPGER